MDRCSSGRTGMRVGNEDLIHFEGSGPLLYGGAYETKYGYHLGGCSSSRGMAR